MRSYTVCRAWLGSFLVVTVLLRPTNEISAQDRAQSSGRPEAPGRTCSDVSELQHLDLADAVSQSLQTQPQLIIAQQDVLEARSDVRAAVAPFLPSRFNRTKKPRGGH